MILCESEVSLTDEIRNKPLVFVLQELWNVSTESTVQQQEWHWVTNATSV